MRKQCTKGVMQKKGFFVASTGQHVGKTTTCLGLISRFKKTFFQRGIFIKPVGQEQMETACGQMVDKDVILFKEHFNLKASYEDMSPVLLPQGFTRDFLDGESMQKSLDYVSSLPLIRIQHENNFTVVEGTGHIRGGLDY